MTSDEKGANFEITRPTWNECKFDCLCNWAVSGVFSHSKWQSVIFLEINKANAAILPVGVPCCWSGSAARSTFP